ncbi:Transcription factor [Dirofilaria immitis]
MIATATAVIVIIIITPTAGDTLSASIYSEISVFRNNTFVNYAISRVTIAEEKNSKKVKVRVLSSVVHSTVVAMVVAVGNSRYIWHLRATISSIWGQVSFCESSQGLREYHVSQSVDVVYTFLQALRIKWRY